MGRWTDLAPRQEHTTEQGGAMLEHRGLVVHIAEGFYEGTIAWQQGNNSVSSHFIVDRDGTICQMVDTDVTAWTQRAGNGHWLSVEFAGFTTGNPLHAQHPGWERLTAEQVDACARLLARAHRVYRVPLQVATAPDGRGVGHHSMGGTAWGHLDCPGDPIIAQKQSIVDRAKALLAPGPAEEDTVQVELTQIGERHVLVNPATATGHKTWLSLAADFGDGTVRVATYDDHWTVTEYKVEAAGPDRSPLLLDTSVRKVSVVLQEATDGAVIAVSLTGTPG